MPTTNDHFIQKLIDIVEASFGDEHFGVSELAEKMNMERSVLYRKVKVKTGKSVSAFIRKIRIEKAYELLKNESGNVSEVAAMVGFSGVQYFTNCFRDFYGFPPGEVLKRNGDNSDHQKLPNQKKWFLRNNVFVVSSFIFLVILSYFLFRTFFLDSKNNNELIEFSSNDAALNLYLTGIDYLNIYERIQESENFFEAKRYLETALELDSTFAEAWLKLGQVYIEKYAWFEIQKNFRWDIYHGRLDSGFVMLQNAIKYKINKEYEHELNRVFWNYESNKGYSDKALEILEKYWKGKQKNHLYYYDKSQIYHAKGDSYNAIKNTLDYLDLLPHGQLPDYESLKKLSKELKNVGFPDVAEIFAKKLYLQLNDSIGFKKWKLETNLSFFNLNLAEKELCKLLEQDPNNIENIYSQFLCKFYLRNFDEAFTYRVFLDSISNASGVKQVPDPFSLYLYKYYNNDDMYDLAIVDYYHFFGQLDYEIYIPKVQQNNYEITRASYYAIIGENEKVLNILNQWIGRDNIPYQYIFNLSEMPFWDELRKKPEFSDIIDDISRKHKRLYKQVEILLKKKGLYS